MESFIILLVMFVTIVGPSLVFVGVLGIPITLIILAARGKQMTAKVILISVAAVLFIPIVAELIAVISLVVLFQIFGRG